MNSTLYSNQQSTRQSSTTSAMTSTSTHYENISANNSSEWDWDLKLNTLLEDLQRSVLPLEGANANRTYGKSAAWTEHERRKVTSLFSHPITNEVRVQSTAKEKLADLGQTLTQQERQQSQSQVSQPFYLSPQLHRDGLRRSSGRTAPQSGAKSGPFKTANQSQMEYIDASNIVTVLRSAESSPSPGPGPPVEYKNVRVATPRTERKEYYSASSSSYSSKNIIHGGRNYPSDSGFIPPRNYPEPSEPYSKSPKYANDLGQPLYTSTPKPAGNNNGGGGPRTTPLSEREIFQHRNESYKTSCNTDGTFNYPDTYDYDEHDSSKIIRNPVPVGVDNNIQKDPPQKFYTATTTRTETKSHLAEDPAVRIFPTKNRNSGRGQQNGGIGQPPKRLDELLATFDESFIETSKIVGDGGGPHKSHPYGPGTYPMPRSVRIDESANMEKEIIEKYTDALSSKNTNTNNVNNDSAINYNNNSVMADTSPMPSANLTGPPVFYPIQEKEQLFIRTQNEMLAKSSGQAQGKMERKYKRKETSKQSHSEKGGGGALPVPVCLPVCCAAPCVIL